MAVKTYDAGQVSVIVGTSAIKGLAEGTFVAIARDEQLYTKQVGADGEVTRAKTNNNSGTITITVQQASDGNDILSAIANAGSVVPITVVDGSGRTVAFGESAWVQDLPDVEFGRDAAEREWVIDVANLSLVVGGN